MAYSEKVMDHSQHPRNVGEIENASGVGTVGNAKCGDNMRIFFDIDDETHIIKDCKFKTFGCGAAVATSSMATELIKGKSIDEALKLTNSAVVKLWKVYPPQSFIAPFLRKKLLKRLSITTMPAKKAEPTANATAFPAATTMSMKKMPKTDF